MMYIDKKRVTFLINDILNNKNNRVIFSYMNKNENNKVGFKSLNRLVDFWLNLKSEPFKWGMNKEELSAFVNQNNFTLLDLFDGDALTSQYSDQLKQSHLGTACGEVYIKLEKDYDC